MLGPNVVDKLTAKSRWGHHDRFPATNPAGAVTGLTDLRRSPTLPPWISSRTQLWLNLSSPTPVP